VQSVKEVCDALSSPTGVSFSEFFLHLTGGIIEPTQRFPAKHPRAANAEETVPM
jgi:hypothetical protein